MHHCWHKSAVDGDREAIFACLADNGDVDRLDKYGQTALMLSALHGHDAVVSALIENGAGLDVTAKHGLSALMLAIINHRESTAKLLIQANADISLRGRGAPGFANKTGFDLATERGLHEISGLLTGAAADKAEQLINAAFADRMPPAVLSDSKQLLDFEYDEVMTFDQVRWQDVRPHHVEQAGDAVFWFSPEAFCYYLPGFMLSSLRVGSAESNAFDAIIGWLDRSPEPAYWDDFFQPRFTGFKVPELDAISAWVHWMKMVQPDLLEDGTYHRVLDTLELLRMYKITGRDETAKP